MTKQQLDDANALVSRIKRLENLRDHFSTDAVNFDESLVRPTHWTISSDKGFFKEDLNQSEVLFLIEALTKEIDMLKMEFGRI